MYHENEPLQARLIAIEHLLCSLQVTCLRQCSNPPSTAGAERFTRLNGLDKLVLPGLDAADARVFLADFRKAVEVLKIRIAEMLELETNNQ